MTTRSRLARLFVPEAWRETVVRDLADEATAQGRGQLWLAWQTMRAGARLRFAFGGDGLVADVCMVARSLMRAKGFTAAAIVTFALGIGANIAVFSVIDRLLFRPLPYTEPDRLVHIHLFHARDPKAGSFAMVPTELVSYLQAHSTTIEAVAWANNHGAFLQSAVPAPSENPLRLAGLTANGLRVLGVEPVLGRDFTESDAERAWNDEAAILLTHETWQRRFGGSTDVLSRSWSARPTLRVVGVLPPGFVLPSSLLAEKVDGLFVLSHGQTQGENRPGHVRLAPFARLRPGVPLSAAQAEVGALLARPSWASEHLQNSIATQTRAFEERGGPPPVYLQPLQSGLTMFLRPYLWLISAAVWIVLCVACVNLATLLLARRRSRERDAAIRAAVGASPARLVRHALIESVLLCLVASAVALAVCIWGERALLAVVPPAFDAFAVPPLDARIVALTMGTAFACAMLAAMFPAIAATRVDVLSVLHRAGRPGRLTSLRGGASLLAIEAALGVVLVIGGAMVVPGFIELVTKSPGFEPTDLFVLSVNHGGPTDLSMPDANRRSRVGTVLNVIRAEPRVEHAAAALSTLPLDGGSEQHAFWKEHGTSGSVWGVSDGLFDTLGTPMRAGRAFTVEDVHADAPVAIVSETGAHALWPSDPVGRAVGRMVETDAGPRQIVGVVADIRATPDVPPGPALYLPITAGELRPMATALAVAVRMSPGAIPDPALLSSRLNEQFSASSRVPVTSMHEQFAPVLDRPRFLAVLMGGLAAAALLLVAVGLYALASFEVTRRRYEIGVRLALGSPVHAVRRRIVRFAIVPVVAGSIAGGLAAWWAGRLTQTLVAEIDPRNPWAYAGAALLMCVAALLATALPALRAGRIEPVAVIRET